MSKLNQVLAVSKTVKVDANRALTGAHQALQKQPLLQGVVRVYSPKDDDGEQLPSESQKVQLHTDLAIDDVMAKMIRMFEVVGTIDATNCVATADIEVDGVILVPNVPATHLLWLEKQLVDLRTFVSKLPVLDPQYNWTFDTAQGVWTTEERKTHRTRKVPRNHVRAEATDKHPAQVEVYYEDIIVGYWSTRNLSGAMRQVDVTILLERVTRVQEAVKRAREAANATAAVTFTSAPLINYLFAR